MSQIVEVRMTPMTNFEPKEEAPFKILQIFISPGQKIFENDRLAEIENDKGLQEIEAPQNGTVKDILVPADPGIEYLYGTVFCTIETD